MPVVFTDEQLKRKQKRLLTAIACAIAFISIVAGVIWGFSQFSSKEEAPQSQPTPTTPMSSPSAAESGTTSDEGPERNEELFTEASKSEVSVIEQDYDMSALDGVSKEDNPFEATPFGIFPYRIEVDQVWKDTYGSDWQTMTASTLSTLSSLWSDSAFENPVMVGGDDDIARVQKIRDLTYRDVIYKRIGPASGVTVGNDNPREPTLSDYSYYNAVVPVLDASGNIPGTSTKPGTQKRTVSVLDVSVEGPSSGNADASASYVNYPRMTINRLVDYGSVKYTQKVSFYIQKAGDDWKIVQVEWEPPTIL